MWFWKLWWHFAYFIQYFFLKLIFVISRFNNIIRFNVDDRRTFELRYSDLETINFDFGFHVSSEGELSQIHSLLEFFLKQNKSIILFFTSPSVEKKVLALREGYPNLKIRAVIFTKMDFHFLKNIKIRHFSMCRYDFLPWLMILGLKTPHFFLLNATSIKWRNSLFFKKFLRGIFYDQFNLITTSSKNDELIFRNLLPHKAIMNIDLRAIEIKNRQKNFYFSDVYKKNKEILENLKNHELTYCFGSAWSEDLQLLSVPEINQKFKKPNTFVYVFPHDLKSSNLNNMIQKCKENGFEINIINFSEDFERAKSGIINLVMMRGLLCEMYPFFKNVIVGGGFGESVHSVLEPMLAGCITYCGPNVFRSTEVENYKELLPSRIFVNQNIMEMAQNILHQYSQKTENESRGEDVELCFNKLVGFYET